MAKESDISNRSTIPFRRPINTDEAKELLDYLAENLPPTVSMGYISTEARFIHHFSGTDDRIIRRKRVVSIEGTISWAGFAPHESFSLRPDSSDPECYAYFQYNALDDPFVDKGEGSEIGKLWDMTRVKIREYFSKHPQF